MGVRTRLSKLQLVALSVCCHAIHYLVGSGFVANYHYRGFVGAVAHLRMVPASLRQQR
ncbi:MAG: hypothetical protein GY782_12290 [Gammaproteobacteria bacterium]|nr:hypothetical protein [Gammaproteobacteria bacterium]